MLFLIQLKEKIDGTYEKGTSQYDNSKDAVQQLYTAMSSAIVKADTKKICCVLMDDTGIAIKREMYTAEISAPISEEVSE